MHELLQNPAPGALVLDIGCAEGSFDSTNTQFIAIRIDLERGGVPGANFAQADAAKLPFPDNCFAVVISNHSLEHFEDLAAALAEIGRVIRPNGALYVGAPDASTVSDRLYRWMSRGGGHVNPFYSSGELEIRIERATGLRHRATRTLCTSFCFLNRKNRRSRPPKRLLLLGGGSETVLFLLNYVAGLADRFLKTRMSVYGWALYFGEIGAPVDCRTWTNVCIRCGSGYSSDWLHDRRLVRRFLSLFTYRCPHCKALNPLKIDKDYDHFEKI